MSQRWNWWAFLSFYEHSIHTWMNFGHPMVFSFLSNHNISSLFPESTPRVGKMLLRNSAHIFSTGYVTKFQQGGPLRFQYFIWCAPHSWNLPPERIISLIYSEPLWCERIKFPPRPPSKGHIGIFRKQRKCPENFPLSNFNPVVAPFSVWHLSRFSVSRSL